MEDERNDEQRKENYNQYCEEGSCTVVEHVDQTSKEHLVVDILGVLSNEVLAPVGDVELSVVLPDSDATPGSNCMQMFVLD